MNLNPIPTWVLGDGGQARELGDMLRRHSFEHDGRPLRYEGLVGPGVEAQVLTRSGAAVLGLGFPGLRSQLLRKVEQESALTLPVLIHPTADVSDSSAFNAGVVITAFCVVSTDVRLGAGTLVNPRGGIGHDSALGRCCVVNGGATIAGNVTIGDGVLVGAGATVLQGLAIGDGAVVGAGAVVTRDVAAETVVVGVPARQHAQEATDG